MIWWKSRSELWKWILKLLEALGVGWGQWTLMMKIHDLFFGFYYVLLGDLSCFLYGNFATVCNITFKRLLVLLPNPWGDWGGVLPDPATVVLWGVWTLEGYFGLVWKSSSDCPVYFNFLYKQNVNFFCGSPLHAFLNL